MSSPRSNEISLEEWLSRHGGEPLLVGHDASGAPVEMFVNPTGRAQNSKIPLLLLLGTSTPRQHITFEASIEDLSNIAGCLSIAFALNALEAAYEAD